jgi:hypothetical protein
MTITEELTLKAFKKFRIPSGGVLKAESFSAEMKRWHKAYQEEAFSARKKLIDGGYLSIKDKCYILTDKGYNYIYKDYSVIDTEKLILTKIGRHGIDVGNIIMTGWLNSLQLEAERFHSDNFNNAIQNLMEKGFIETVEIGYRLTQEGYSKIYEHVVYNIAS